MSGQKEVVGTQMMDPTFLDQVRKMPGGEKLASCIQCGICSGSCTTSFAAEFNPRQVIELIQLGLGDKALSTPSIWTCVFCRTCTVRCPQGIDIPELMSSLRIMAVRRGALPREDRNLKFHQAFWKILRANGRLDTFRLYSRLADMQEIARSLPVGLTLLRKGKLTLRTPSMTHPEQLSRLTETAKPEEASPK